MLLLVLVSKKRWEKCTFNFLKHSLFCGQGYTVSRPLKNPIDGGKHIYVEPQNDGEKTKSKEAILRCALMSGGER